MKTRTVRELGGEIWAEHSTERQVLLAQGGDSLKNLDWQTLNRAIDLIMPVLARHAETIIVNDTDLPVTPLPKR